MYRRMRSCAPQVHAPNEEEFATIVAHRTVGFSRRRPTASDPSGHVTAAMGKSGVAPGIVVVGVWAPPVSSLTR